MNIQKSYYFEQTKLLLEILPYVLEEECFALKGGTAINLFYRNMPRISVDIDLNYLPLEPREESLSYMEGALKRIAQTIQKRFSDIEVQEVHIRNPKMVSKLTAKRGDAKIKIEPNLVIRGTVFPCRNLTLCAKAQELFGIFCEARVVSLADIFGGKICAALDRQHPRDLYDIYYLLNNEGLTSDILKAFVVYLAGHDRPMHELLDPSMQDFKKVYESEFQGMADEMVSFNDLVQTRVKLLEIIKKEMTRGEKEFLLSVKEGSPRWDLIDIPHIESLPAIQWKVMNVRRMTEEKRRDSYRKLKAILGQ